MIVVSNTTPIISFASINKIDILKFLFEKIYIPQAVYDEIKSKKAFGYREIDDDFFQVKQIKNKLSENILLNELDLGEAQTIILAKEINADIVLIDENIGYNIAKSQQLNVKRTLSLLIVAKNKGYIDNIQFYLEELVNNGRWFSKNVINEVLKICGEYKKNYQNIGCKNE